jgi:hypothetical protein
MQFDEVDATKLRFAETLMKQILEGFANVTLYATLLLFIRQTEG